MKLHTLAFLLFLLGLSWNSKAQTSYHHYLDSTYYWYEADIATHIGAGNPPCLFGGDDLTQRYFHIIGESFLAGEWWYAIHQDYQITHYCSGGNATTDPVHGSTQASFWLREDSSRKIWGLLPTGPPVLLFDFGQPLGIGDTLWMNDRQFACPIAAIDSVGIGNQFRARYHCQCDTLAGTPKPSYVIEGAGLNEGIFGFDNLCNDFPNFIATTICLGIQGDTLSLDTTYACGTPEHTTVSVDPSFDLGLSLRWNPSKHILTISPFPQAPSFRWELWNMGGQLIRQGRIESDQIELTGLASGIYLFTVTDGSRRQTLRIAQF